ncbi:Sugar kinase [hydrothermal vent metagenome]|uniref:Sugar kinase n=1 Tax=hydrothermal vent metagenome TaxID=652676 RepID=A0A3B1A3Q2_9ZZZZ
MSALICGSFAYDTIMVFQDKFKNHILPDKVHILNVSFLVPEMRREFGGCAGNIAFSLKMLGGDPKPMATVGNDFSPYATWMDLHGIDRSYLRELGDAYTAQAFITTDQDDNQITAFHPGAMNNAHENKISDAKGITIGMVSPDGRDGMIQHAAEFAESGIPFIFDPGQGLPMFNGDELMTFIDQATWVAANDYESQLIQDRTGKSIEELSKKVEAFVVTRGGEGSYVYTNGKCLDIPTAKTAQLLDPTGCGDAYRGGLLYGIMNKLDWETTARIAALMGAIKIEQAGTQNHKISVDEFKQRFNDNYGFTY